MRRVSVITTASGNGGTTFSRDLAARLDVPFHELDALFWKPEWTESSVEELRELVEPWNVFFSRDSLLLFNFRHYRRRHRLYPERLAAFNVIRLRDPVRGRALPELGVRQSDRQVTDCYLGRFARFFACSRISAIQAAVRKPSQIGVKST